MKRKFAKFLMWLLKIMGYSHNYTRKNETKIHITCDASELLIELEKTKQAIEELQKQYQGLPKFLIKE